MRSSAGAERPIPNGKRPKNSTTAAIAEPARNANSGGASSGGASGASGSRAEATEEAREADRTRKKKPGDGARSKEM